jgi:putative glycosyltransferase (TIGR04348 family)
MRFSLICPAPPGSRLGNRVTAVRWQKVLRALGHRVTISRELPKGPYDVLIALHALRSADAVAASRALYPERPIVVALTGTDLYRDIREDDDAKRSLALADRLVVLHDGGALALPRAMRKKARVIRQSCGPLSGPRGHDERTSNTSRRHASKRRATFDIAFVAHLRPEKDPLRAACAARLLPKDSRVRIVHVGRALTDEMRRAAEREALANPRYVWRGEVTGAEARRLIAHSQVMVLTSLMEGGANVLGEAVTLGTPPLASRIAAASSALGDGYPGLFRARDTRGLARLFGRVENDPAFLAELRRAARARRRLFLPSVERAAWRALVRELHALTK